MGFSPKPAHPCLNAGKPNRPEINRVCQDDLEVCGLISLHFPVLDDFKLFQVL
ncbi:MULTISPECIES: hypothetical protein [unclassified Leptolyngbya]|uniref:hypothetical protein n=1 Tax=unclassified Leptolyngbya TaxID=2650499 RepID=UPI001689E658|nr:MULTISPECIES: hypothetical protein [unclassified Leptolyngbya]MBD1911188.1 hypothetical protein [Leptolyngbya sp. FACHB-8]MBD2155435.1 hypothetical protein [Leptolyngbya sp. FACHB-16]